MNDFLVPRKRRQLSREQSLLAIPVRNPEVSWEEVEGETGLEVRLRVAPPRGRLFSVLRPVFLLPNKPREIQLDALGSEIWKLCDGERTVQDLCEVLREEYKLSLREAILSLTTYLKQLGKRGLVAFAVPKEPVSRKSLKDGECSDRGTEEPSAQEEKA